MRRLDHSTILLFIAGTYTPFALLAFDGPIAKSVLTMVWCGAAAGLVLNLLWVDAPTWVTVLVYLAVGWVGRHRDARRCSRGSASPARCSSSSAARCTRWARVTYALPRPNPFPATFGFHEIFHVLVVAAAATQFVAVAAFVVPYA